VEASEEIKKDEGVSETSEEEAKTIDDKLKAAEEKLIVSDSPLRK
jgi:hypothetical protein